MNILIAGGTGFIGQALVKHFLAQNHLVSILGRDAEKIKKVFNQHVKILTWNSLTSADLTHFDLLINLTGANIGDKRWNEKSKQEVIDSRVESTKTLCQLISQTQTNLVWINADGVGIYGTQEEVVDGLPEALDENTEIQFDQLEGPFLSRVSKLWEKAALPAKTHCQRLVFIRLGAVLGSGGGALAKLKIPFNLGLGSILGSGQQPFSWIALDDLVKAIDFIYKNSNLSGAINLVAPQCVTQKQFAQTLAKVLSRPLLLKTPAAIVKLMFGEMAEELLLKGQNVKPEKLLKAGFKFDFPELEAALAHYLKKY